MRCFGQIQNRPCKIALMVICGLLLASTLALVFGYAVMLLWNCLLPTIFAWPSITFWQALGLLLLSRLLFGGFGHCKYNHKWQCDGDEPGKKYEKWWQQAGAKAFCCSSREPEASKEEPSS